MDRNHREGPWKGPSSPGVGVGVRESCEAHSELVGNTKGEEEAGQILSPETRGS